MLDANTHALNQMLEEQDKEENARDAFMKEIEPGILEIDKMVKELRVICKDYRGYDFSEELDDELKGML